MKRSCKKVELKCDYFQIRPKGSFHNFSNEYNSWITFPYNNAYHIFALQKNLWSSEEYLLLAIFYDVCMIDRSRFKNKSISFEISLGNVGNRQFHQRGHVTEDSDNLSGGIHFSRTNSNNLKNKFPRENIDTPIQQPNPTEKYWNSRWEVQLFTLGFQQALCLHKIQMAKFGMENNQRKLSRAHSKRTRKYSQKNNPKKSHKMRHSRKKISRNWTPPYPSKLRILTRRTTMPWNHWKHVAMIICKLWKRANTKRKAKRRNWIVTG